MVDERAALLAAAYGRFATVGPTLMDGLRVGVSPGRGRGVFATRAFKAGEVIEVSPVIVIPREQRELIEETILGDYWFEWGDAPEGENPAAIALGYVSLYNHSYDPNAAYVMDYEQRTMEVVARRDIRAGDELVVTYNGEPTDLTERWRWPGSHGSTGSGRTSVSR